MPYELTTGAYEALHTAALDARVARTPYQARYDAVTDAASPQVLADHVATVVSRLLSNLPPADRLARVNALLAQVNGEPDPVVALEQLMTLTEQVAPGAQRLIPVPTIKLSETALLTNAQDQPNLGASLASEIGSANQVDLLCAFIKFSGIRVIKEQLEGLRERGVPFRVITTTYMGATERRAIDQLVRDLGAEVRISYNSRSTRLHAKAWLFHRNTGFDTGYVGSSNLSRAAMVDGLEWNVRISSVATPTLVRQFTAAFETYWNDEAFRPYDPDRDAELLDQALREAGMDSPPGTALVTSGLQVRPYPHQRQMLEALTVEREVRDRHRNLLVAATGTGKTVVAALDYLRLAEAARDQPSLLFVAHRKEILEQSLRTYREVLGDGAFGELFVDGRRPVRWHHVFASVQGLTRAVLDGLDPDLFEIVVIDEFHHAEAATYRRLLDHLMPRELLGLTATPERTDGVNVSAFFDGCTAYELRLWDALDQDLLCPFHYYGVADGTDLTSVEWSHGYYDLDGLSGLYTGNDARARTVLNALADTMNDPGAIRALGFCVSVDHAQYMARVFTQAGLPSRAVSGESSREDRAAAFAALRAGEVRCLFAVDLFNEGLDIPDVDTLLLLRPTQSATVFLQQLGRGLRRTRTKAVLTVLDFIGQQRREFRFDLKLRALTGGTRAQLVAEIEAGFPFLPSGSRMVLDRVASQTVLDSVRASMALGARKELIRDLSGRGDVSLGRFLDESGRELSDVYRGGGTWTALRRGAGTLTTSPGADEAALLRRMSALAHIDDPERAAVYRLLTSPDAPDYDELDPRQQHIARMLFFLLWPNKGDHASYGAGLATLRANPAIGEEVSQLLDVALERIHHVPGLLGASLAHLPLLSHATYRREEVLAGINWANSARKAAGHSEGVAYSDEEGLDAFMVTLHKDSSGFSASTMYRDYPVSRLLFHWETQNNTAVSSERGQRYLSKASHKLLFVRDARENDLGSTPYLCLGTVSADRHQGERPIAITWRLDRPMPIDVLQSGAVVAS